MSSLQLLLNRVLPTGRFRRGVAVLVGGTALGQGLIVLASPILSRLYVPSDMGLMGLYVAFSGFASVAVSLRYETAIVSCKDSKEAAHLVLVCAILAIPMSFGLSGVLYFVIVFSVLGFGVLSPYAAALAFPSSLFIATFLILRYWFIRDESFVTISRVLVSQNGARAAAQIGLGLTKLGWIGLLLGDLVGRGLGINLMLRSSWRAITQELFPLQFPPLLYVLKRYRKFPIYSLPSSLVDALALNLPIPLIAQLYGPQEAGYFTLVQRVLMVPLVLVGSSVADTFHARISSYSRETPRQVVPFFLRTAGVLLAFGVGPGVLLMMFGQAVFSWVFGEEWATAGLLVTAMVPLALAQLVVSPLSRVVFVFQGQELKLVYDVFSLLATLGIFIMAYSSELPLLHTIGLLSLTQTFVNGIYFLLLLRVVIIGARRTACVE
jgi:lipopolysaccharide exporter